MKDLKSVRIKLIIKLLIYKNLKLESNYNLSNFIFIYKSFLQFNWIKLA